MIFVLLILLLLKCSTARWECHSPRYTLAMVIDARIHCSLQIDYNVISIVYHTVTVPFGLRSTGSSPALTMKVTNQRNEAVTVYWVNYSGNLRSYGTIQHGHTWTVRTYGTHPWLIVNPRGEIIGIYIPYTAAGETLITVK